MNRCFPQLPPEIEIGADGRLLDPPGSHWLDRLVRYAVIVAAVAALIALAALAFWLALILIPVAFLAALFAYLGWRWRMWKLGGGRGFPFC